MRFLDSLSSKSALLVTLIVMTQITFAVWLWNIGRQVEVMATKVGQRSSSLTEATHLLLELNGCFDLANTVASVHGKVPPGFNGRCLNINQGLDKLLELFADSTPEYKAASRVVIVGRRALDHVLSPAPSTLQLSNQQGIATIRADFAHEVESFLNTVKLSNNDNIEAIEQLRQTQLLGCAVNSAVLVVLLGTLVRGLAGFAGGLRLLSENSIRMGKGLSLHPVLRGGDEIAALDKMFHDMADEVAKSQRKERAVVDYAADVICSIDSGGRFTALNPAISKLTGYQVEHLLGRYYWELLSEQDRERLNQELQEIKQTGRRSRLEVNLLRLDRKIAHSEWSVLWSTEEQRWFCVIHDITDRKQLEELKQQFVRMVSHDLRTPLTSIKFFLSGIQLGNYGEQTAELRENTLLAINSTDRLITLINDLLDLDKLESGQMELRCSLVDLRSMVSKSIQAVSALLDANNISLEDRTPRVFIYADEHRLTQVMVNLLGNAINFSRPGTAIEVDACEREEWLEVRVTDHGTGVDKEQQQVIFERFKQLNTGVESSGSGLGLAICKAIIEAHSGQIGVESEAGAGSSFWFRLPMLSS